MVHRITGNTGLSQRPRVISKYAPRVMCRGDPACRLGQRVTIRGGLQKYLDRAAAGWDTYVNLPGEVQRLFGTNSLFLAKLLLVQHPP